MSKERLKQYWGRRRKIASNDLSTLGNQAHGATFASLPGGRTASRYSTKVADAYNALHALNDEMETASIKTAIRWQHCEQHDTEFTLRCPKCA